MTAVTRMTLVLALLAAACSAPESGTEAAGTWVGTITTEGQLSTVINESGSVWGGTATLAEEMSIGVEAGDEAYMFGRIMGIDATEDEIYVLDEQKPAVRVYDFNGEHLRDIGGRGAGPGEFQRPRWVMVTAEGRVLVISRRNNRVNVYGPEPGSLDSWPLMRGTQCCLHASVVAPDGVIWTEFGIVNEATRSYVPAMQAHGPDGAIGDPVRVPAIDYQRWTFRFDGREIEAIPFAPEIVWAIHPAGLMVAGANDRYRFEIRSPAGERTVVERYWDPVEVISEEEQYSKGYVRQVYGRTEGGDDAGLEWDGRIPESKPAFRSFIPSRSGEIWVLREGPATPRADCDPAELVESPFTGSMLPKRCFTTSWIIDVFDGEGRYLGEVDFGRALLGSTRTFIRGGTVITESQDPMGTIMVKRYRLVLPGEADLSTRQDLPPEDSPSLPRQAPG